MIVKRGVMIVNVKNETLGIDEKTDMLFRVLDAAKVVPDNMKDKIEGIIIGVSLRERMERVERSTSNG